MAVIPLVALGYVLLVVLIGLAVFIYRGRQGLRQAIADELRPHVRSIINELANSRSSRVLMLAQAPGLAAEVESQYHIDRPELDRIKRLIDDLGASAIAVSGPRGAGKTTLLQGIGSGAKSKKFVVSVDAPASYEPQAFTVLLFRRMCDEIMRELKAGRNPGGRALGQFLNVLRRTLRVAVFSAMVALVLVRVRPGINGVLSAEAGRYFTRTTTDFVAGLVSLATIWLLLGMIRPRRTVPAGSQEMVMRAFRESQRLAYLQNLSTEISGTLKLKAGIDLGRKSTKQMVQRAASYPDVVEAYREFAGKLALWLRSQKYGRLIVVIDELDRIVDGDAAERFLNEIKGIFAVPGCTYLVTVSEDALARFERRMVGIRPTLDSTFDEVLRLEALTFDRSRRLLTRRLVGFPAIFSAVCHSLSGGIPRELVRAARAFLQVRESTGRRDLDTLLIEVVRSEVAGLKSGLIPRVAAIQKENDRQDAVLVLLADDSWPGTRAEDLLRAASEFLTDSAAWPGEVGRVTRQLAASLLYYGTILETFDKKNAWNSDVLGGVSEGLALVRAALPVSADLALSRLRAFRAEHSLVALPPETAR